LFGDGTIRKIKSTVTHHRKDSGVDVMAWCPRNDKTPGTLYLLGQAASGGNWTGKSFVSDVTAFHEDWFDEQPVSKPLPYTLVPHHITVDQARKYRHHLGSLRGRLILPADTAKGVAVASGGATVEGIARVPEIAQWLKTISERSRAEV
jgi:hypothetical protein